MTDITRLPETRTIKLANVVFSADLYPRKAHDPALVQKYAACIDEIEARNNFISIAVDGTLLDGRHRHLAYLKCHEDRTDTEIPAYVYDVTENKDKFALAVELNSTHGYQLNEDDKKTCALDLYGKYRYELGAIAKMVAVRKEKVLDWTKGIREEETRRENETIFDMWMACYIDADIAKVVGIDQSTVSRRTDALCNEFPGTKSIKLSNFEDAGDGFQVPIYNQWTFAKKTNDVAHFGNSEQRILENLLYLYTNPFDIVFDPFGGGGSTIDVCKRRLRRYWVGDRKPSVERQDEIRKHDLVTEGLPALRWSDVTLTYLDPPYWRQAKEKYSKDAEDFANMSLDEFTDRLAGVVRTVAAKQKSGVIALLIQPTQWSADDRQFTDHVTDLVRGVGNKRMILENRVSCPYSTEQYNPQQVEWAKANRKLLVITRELIIWRLA